MDKCTIQSARATCLHSHSHAVLSGESVHFSELRFHHWGRGKDSIYLWGWWRSNALTHEKLSLIVLHTNGCREALSPHPGVPWGCSLSPGFTQVDSVTYNRPLFIMLSPRLCWNDYLNFLFGFIQLRFWDILSNQFLTYYMWKCQTEDAHLKQMKRESCEFSSSKVKINDA